MEEVAILENVVAEVMVVTKSTGVAGKLELRQHNMVGATDRQVIGPIVMLSQGGLKQRHLMLLSQVLFWSDCMVSVLFNPGSTFLYVSSSFFTGLDLIVICLTCLFVSLLLWVSL